MLKMITGIAVADVVLFAWGFLFWGLANPYYSRKIWKTPVNEAELAPAMKAHFPENGVYFIPSETGSEEKLDERYKRGPVAFVQMLRVNGRNAFDFGIMAKGFAANTVFVIGLAMLLWFRQGGFLPRLLFVTACGASSAFLANVGDIAWWELDPKWELYRGIYHLTAWIVAGAALAWFVPARPRLQ